MKHKLTLVLLSFFLGVQCMVAQQMKVTGVVINEDDGEPVIGASIVVKGTTIGTITDLDGKFELETQKDAKLIISYVGLRTQETTAQQNMRIVLSSDSQAIDEVVVVAYGTAKKSSFTGSASTVGAALMDKRPLSNALSALEGNTSGVQMTSSIGQPGEAAKVTIRGFGSVNADNAPLYVVDGAIFSGDISSISPSDIESMTILKDAASTSLYGSSAGNGVVLITTKKGSTSSGAGVTLSISQGWSSRAYNDYAKVGVYDYYPLQWQMLRNANMSLGQSAADAAANASMYALASPSSITARKPSPPSAMPNTGRVTRSLLTCWASLAVVVTVRSSPNTATDAFSRLTLSLSKWIRAPEPSGIKRKPSSDRSSRPKFSSRVRLYRG